MLARDVMVIVKVIVKVIAIPESEGGKRFHDAIVNNMHNVTSIQT